MLVFSGRRVGVRVGVYAARTLRRRELFPRPCRVGKMEAWLAGQAGVKTQHREEWLKTGDLKS
jgi:hypothetical protein